MTFRLPSQVTTIRVLKFLTITHDLWRNRSELNSVPLCGHLGANQTPWWRQKPSIRGIRRSTILKLLTKNTNSSYSAKESKNILVFFFFSNFTCLSLKPPWPISVYWNRKIVFPFRIPTGIDCFPISVFSGIQNRYRIPVCKACGTITITIN